MKVALFGGAFNPPHIGHVMIARQVLDYAAMDEVWFVPNFGQHPPKSNVALVSDRLAMVQLLKQQAMKISTLEIDHKLDGNTIHLLPFLPNEHAYTFVIGSDQLPVFHLWGKWQELLERLPFFVFPRHGYPARPVYKNMTVVSHKSLIVTDISSTKLRERVKMGLPIDAFVPQGVSRYIQEHGLYRE